MKSNDISERFPGNGHPVVNEKSNLALVQPKFWVKSSRWTTNNLL